MSTVYIHLYSHDLMLFDYAYNLILQTCQFPISSDNRLSTVVVVVVCMTAGTCTSDYSFCGT